MIRRGYCSPYERLDGVTPAEHPYRRIVLIKRADGTDRNSPRDFRSYDGRGASKALLLAIDRASAQMQAAHDRGDISARIDSGERALRLHEMALCQVEREQGVRESEAE